MKKSENGITLVALVVTIIILLLISRIGITALTQTGLFENAITLPLHTKLTDEEVKYVTDVLKECIG